MTQVNEIRPLTEEQLEAEINQAGWYVRQENNGWRPVFWGKSVILVDF